MSSTLPNEILLLLASLIFNNNKSWKLNEGINNPRQKVLCILNLRGFTLSDPLKQQNRKQNGRPSAVNDTSFSALLLPLWIKCLGKVAFL